MHSGDLQSVEECIRIGSYWSDWRENASLLTVAIEKGYEDIALALLAAQTLCWADIRAALDLASDKGLEGVVQKLIDTLMYSFQEGASYEECEFEALSQEQINDLFRHASLQGNWLLLRHLLERGCCIGILSKEEQEELLLHAFDSSGRFVDGCMFVVQALLQNGAVTVSILSRKNLKHLLIHACFVDNMIVADALITNNCDVNCVDWNGITPLMVAAHRGHEELVKKLIFANAKVEMQDSDGLTALHHAASQNRIQCGILLVEGGASVRTKSDYSKTPLEMALSPEFRKAIREAVSFTTQKTLCIIGNAEGGKSTLVAALQAERSSFLGRTINRLRRVDDRLKRTAGIDTITHGSQKYGEVLFFDFAGQHEYHGPHQVFLESLLSKPGVSMTLLLVVKATEVEDAIRHQLHRWLSPLALATTDSPPRVIVIGSFLDKVQSKQEATAKLTRCIEATRKDLEELPLEFVGSCLLNCRQPQSEGMDQLCRFLEEVPVPEFRSTHMQYSLAWVLSQIRSTQMARAVQLQKFSKWIQDHKRNLPKTMPPPKEVCQDLSAAGHALYIPNKEDPLKSWLVLDLPGILHDMYGILFSKSKEMINEFGLLHCCHLSSLFPDLDVELVQQLLVSLEFCIPVDPSVLKVEMRKLTQSEETSGWLFFPALIAKSTPTTPKDATKQSVHYLCWQLRTSKKHSISARILQTILLRLAAHFVVQQRNEEGVQQHCRSIWWNGIAWQSKRGVDIAVHITNNRVIQVVGMSNMSADILCHYLSDVISDILLTVHQLSPNLAAAAYIVHLPKMTSLHEDVPDSSPKELFLVEDIRNSIAGHEDYTLSCKDTFGLSSRLPVPDLFGGWNPSLEDIERILWRQPGPSRPQSSDGLSMPTSTLASTDPPASLTAASGDSLPTPTVTSGNPQRPHTLASNKPPTAASADHSTPTATLHPSPPSGAQALLHSSSVPTLNDMNELIVTQVAANWYNLALVLGVEVFLIDAISEDHRRCVAACRDMLTRWLRREQHTGGEQRTWSTLLTALGRADFGELESSLRREHFYN